MFLTPTPDIWLGAQTDHLHTRNCCKTNKRKIDHLKEMVSIFYLKNYQNNDVYLDTSLGITLNMNTFYIKSRETSMDLLTHA